MHAGLLIFQLLCFEFTLIDCSKAFLEQTGINKINRLRISQTVATAKLILPLIMTHIKYQLQLGIVLQIYRD